MHRVANCNGPSIGGVLFACVSLATKTKTRKSSLDVHEWGEIAATPPMNRAPFFDLVETPGLDGMWFSANG